MENNLFFNLMDLFAVVLFALLALGFFYTIARVVTKASLHEINNFLDKKINKYLSEKQKQNGKAKEEK